MSYFLKIAVLLPSLLTKRLSRTALVHIHHEFKAWCPLQLGSWPAKGPWSSRGLDALSYYYYVSLIFKHSDIKWDEKNQSNIGGGGGKCTCVPPSGSLTVLGGIQNSIQLSKDSSSQEVKSISEKLQVHENVQKKIGSLSVVCWPHDCSRN